MAGWDSRNPFDTDCASSTFHGFVENVLRLEPAWCSRMFEDYVGRSREQEIDFVGRFESLADDLIRALRMAGTSFDPEAIRSTPPVNASTVSRDLSRWTQELAGRVQRSERRAILRFGYTIWTWVAVLLADALDIVDIALAFGA